MSSTLDIAPDTARLGAASALQKLVPPLVALTMDAKQAHWNLVGFGFLPLHDLTDALAGDLRTWTDRAAERAVALGFAVDARPRTVSAAAGDFPAGFVPDHEVVAELAAGLGRLATTARETLAALEEDDAVAHDIVVELLEGVEKYRWMLEAHRS